MMKGNPALCGTMERKLYEITSAKLFYDNMNCGLKIAPKIVTTLQLNPYSYTNARLAVQILNSTVKNFKNIIQNPTMLLQDFVDV